MNQKKISLKSCLLEIPSVNLTESEDVSIGHMRIKPTKTYKRVNNLV